MMASGFCMTTHSINFKFVFFFKLAHHKITILGRTKRYNVKAISYGYDVTRVLTYAVVSDN